MVRRNSREARAWVVWRAQAGQKAGADQPAEHRVFFTGADELCSGTELLPDEAVVTPGEMFLGAIASAQWLAYRDLCARCGLRLISYRDEALGSMAPGARPGSLPVAITLRPHIVFAATAGEEERWTATALRLINEALSYALPAGSGPFVIEVRPALEFRRE